MDIIRHQLSRFIRSALTRQLITSHGLKTGHVTSLMLHHCIKTLTYVSE